MGTEPGTRKNVSENQPEVASNQGQNPVFGYVLLPG